MNRTRLKWWLPAILLAGLILAASGEQASASHTGDLLRWLIHATFGPVSDATFDLTHFLIRKGGHLLAYGTLGALAFRGARGGAAGWTGHWAAIAVLFAAGTASIDELHQSMIVSRTGMASDVLLDSVGATLAQALWWLRARSKGNSMSSVSLW